MTFWSTFYDVRGKVGNRPWSLVLRQKSFVLKLVNAVIVGDRRRTLVQKKSFEHAQKFSWRPAFFNVSFKRSRTFVERFTNVARVWLSLVSCYPSVTCLLLIVCFAVNNSRATCQRPLN